MSNYDYTIDVSHTHPLTNEIKKYRILITAIDIIDPENHSNLNSIEYLKIRIPEYELQLTQNQSDDLHEKLNKSKEIFSIISHKMNTDPLFKFSYAQKLQTQIIKDKVLVKKIPQTKSGMKQLIERRILIQKKELYDMAMKYKKDIEKIPG